MTGTGDSLAKEFPLAAAFVSTKELVVLAAVVGSVHLLTKYYKNIRSIKRDLFSALLTLFQFL